MFHTTTQMHATPSQNIKPSPVLPPSHPSQKHALLTTSQWPEANMVVPGSSIDAQERRKRIRMLPPSPPAAQNPFNAPTINALENMFERVMALATHAPSPTRWPTLKPEEQDTIASQSAVGHQGSVTKTATCSATITHIDPIQRHSRSVWPKLLEDSTLVKSDVHTSRYRHLFPPADADSTAEYTRELYKILPDKADTPAPVESDSDVVELMSSEDEDPADNEENEEDADISDENEYEEDDIDEEESYNTDDDKDADYEQDPDDDEIDDDLEVMEAAYNKRRRKVTVVRAPRVPVAIVSLDDSDEEPEREEVEKEGEDESVHAGDDYDNSYPPEDEEEEDEDDEDKENRPILGDELRRQRNERNRLRGSMSIQKRQPLGPSPYQPYRRKIPGHDFSPDDASNDDEIETEAQADKQDGEGEIENDASDEEGGSYEISSDNSEQDDDAQSQSSAGPPDDEVVLLLDSDDDNADGEASYENDSDAEAGGNEGLEDSDREEHVDSVELLIDQHEVDRYNDGIPSTSGHGGYEVHHSRHVFGIDSSGSRSGEVFVAGSGGNPFSRNQFHSAQDGITETTFAAGETAGISDELYRDNTTAISSRFSSISDYQQDQAVARQEIQQLTGLAPDNFVDAERTPSLPFLSTDIGTDLSLARGLLDTPTRNMIFNFDSEAGPSGLVPQPFTLAPQTSDELSESELASLADIGSRAMSVMVRLQEVANEEGILLGNQGYASDMALDTSAASFFAAGSSQPMVSREESTPIELPSEQHNLLIETSPPAPRKPRLTRSRTILETVKDGEAFLERSETKSSTRGLPSHSTESAGGANPDAVTTTAETTALRVEESIESEIDVQGEATFPTHNLRHRNGLDLLVKEARAFCSGIPGPARAGPGASSIISPSASSAGSSMSPAHSAVTVETLSPSPVRTPGYGPFSPSRVQLGFARRRISQDNESDQGVVIEGIGIEQNVPLPFIPSSTGFAPLQSSVGGATEHTGGVVDLVAERIIQSTVVGNHALRPYINPPPLPSGALGLGLNGTGGSTGGAGGQGSSGSRSNSQEPVVSSPLSHTQPGVPMFSFGQTPFGSGRGGINNTAMAPSLSSASVGFGFGMAFVNASRDQSVGAPSPSPSPRKNPGVRHSSHHHPLQLKAASTFPESFNGAEETDQLEEKEDEKVGRPEQDRSHEIKGKQEEEREEKEEGEVVQKSTGDGELDEIDTRAPKKRRTSLKNAAKTK